MYFSKRRDSSADRPLRNGLAMWVLASALCAASGADAQTTPAPANETFKFVPQVNAAGAEETSPDGTIKVSVTTDPDGRPLYTITRGAETIIAPSRLGFLFTDQPNIERGMRIERVTHDKADTT